jgi:hypothetical protein
MYWIARILVGAILLTVLVYGVGLLMPAERTVTKTTLIDGLPELVFRIATDVDKYTEWRSGLRSLTVESRGDLWSWTEVSDGGTTIRLRETQKTPLSKFVVEFEGSSGIHGRWVGDFEPSNEDRTKLTCSETMIIDNPLLRLPAYVLFNTGARLDVLLGDLNRRVAGQSPRPDEPPVEIP